MPSLTRYPYLESTAVASPGAAAAPARALTYDRASANCVCIGVSTRGLAARRHKVWATETIDRGPLGILPPLEPALKVLRADRAEPIGRLRPSVMPARGRGV